MVSTTAGGTFRPRPSAKRAMAPHSSSASSANDGSVLGWISKAFALPAMFPVLPAHRAGYYRAMLDALPEDDCRSHVGATYQVA